MNNKSFLVLLTIAAVLVLGVIVENTQTVTAPAPVEVIVDTDSVKEKIRKAGLVPREAMHWKEL